MHLGKRATAEFLGTFWLTFGGCGSAVIAAAYPQLGIGFLQLEEAPIVRDYCCHSRLLQHHF